MRSLAGWKVLGCLACLLGCGCSGGGTPTSQANLPLAQLVSGVSSGSAAANLDSGASTSGGTAPAPQLSVGGTPVTSVSVQTGEILPLDLLWDRPIAEVLVSRQGQSGAWDLKGVTPGAAGPNSATFALVFAAPTNAIPFVLTIQTRSATGQLSEPATLAVTVITQSSTSAPPPPFT